MDGENGLTYYTDGPGRHLVCVPYSIANLHRMAYDLGIKNHWFHRDHYDVPKLQIERVGKRCVQVRSRDIYAIIHGARDGEEPVSEKLTADEKAKYASIEERVKTGELRVIYARSGLSSKGENFTYVTLVPERVREAAD